MQENSPESKRISLHVWLDAAIFARMQIKKKRVGNDKPLPLFGRILIPASETGKCILTDSL